MENELKEICERLFGNVYIKENVRFCVTKAEKTENGWSLELTKAGPLDVDKDKETVGSDSE